MSVGLLGVVLLTAVSLDARERSAPTDAPAVEAAPVPGDRVSALELDARGLDEPTLRAAIELRLPEVDVYSRADGELLADRRAPYVYVEIRRGDARPEHAITMITSDGRVFRRVVPIEDDEPERAVASAVSSTIMAIETGSVAPDETGSTIPQAAEAPAEAPPSRRRPRPRPRPRPRRAGSRRRFSSASRPTRARCSAGPPRYGDVFLGWFGGLGLALRTPAGALALLELRAGGRAIEGRGSSASARWSWAATRGGAIASSSRSRSRCSSSRGSCAPATRSCSRARPRPRRAASRRCSAPRFASHLATWSC
ncbi:MAG: hypothetical protein H6713_20310 [Myxococcales bacterium]|nr:hypothetical protein [Myxococcales bacterium]